MKKTIPAWATLSASQLARAQKQTQMAASSRPKMDAILIEAIKASQAHGGKRTRAGLRNRARPCPTTLPRHACRILREPCLV